MNTFDLTDELIAVKERADALGASIAHLADEADECTTLHATVAKALADSGLARYTVPRQFGGETELIDPLLIAVVREALMYHSAHLDTLFAMQGIGSYALSIGGDEKLKQEWLPRVASLEVIAAIALTEPDAGSDLRGISTVIEPVPGGVRVRGRKSFITNGGVAGYYEVLGKEGDGYSMVFVPADTPGLTVQAGPTLIAPHILGELLFDDVVVPASHRIGEPGTAFSLALATLAVFRASVAGAATGLAQAALDEAVRHAMTREQFGKPLARLGAVSQSLARSWADVETARSITYRAAGRAGQDPLDNLDFSSMAKLVATEAAARVVDRSVQTMGRFGLIRGSKIERLYRNARPLRIYEGASEVLLDSLSRRLEKISR